MPEYRKRKGSDVWHWCKNCRDWPTANYESVVTDKRPTSGELDNECLSKEKAKTCTT